MKARNYIFTINNYTPTILKKFKVVAESLEKHSYICFGLEKGETGTKHIQGYVQLSEQMRFGAVQKYFNILKKRKLDKFHLEKAKGDLKSNQAYTSKEGKWFEFGVARAGQGARTDISDLRIRMRENPHQIKDILKNDDLNYQQLRYVETYSKYAFESRDINNPPKVFWIWGGSGVGKTKKVFKEFGEKNIFSVTDYKWLGDNYFQQQVYLMDDFRPHDIKFNHLLKICDRYPVDLAVKGSFIPLNSEYIIFTSNNSLDHAFEFLDFSEDLDQLKRRVTEFHFSEIKNIPFSEMVNNSLQDF